MALCIYTATLVITMSQIELIAFFTRQSHDLVSMVGVLLKGFHTLLIIKVGLILLWFIQVPLFVLDHDGCV